ncbi:MAG: peptide chain release factor-like protein [Elusimicrobia bacterium]|nr:peptide chain release factor-like protein [Elusimicrobiota bacterium]
MNLTERFDVSPAKVQALRERIERLKINPALIQEKFVRGGGPGGQKINKTANRVQLYYPPLDMMVRAQKDRRRTVNRFLALRELVDRIEMRISPETSERLKEVERLRRRKDRHSRKARLKYQT